MQLSSVASSSGAPSSAFSINGKRVKPPSDRACGRLAPLISSVVDTRKIESWDTAQEFAPIVGILRDIRRFEALFMDKKPARHLRRSKMSSDNVDLLEDGDTIEDTDNFLCCMSVFQVPKKVDDRFIADASPINKLQETPPKANIPQVHSVLSGLLARLFLFSIDAINYFYQFLLEDPDIRKYFSMAFNRRRGKPLLRRMKRIPMGWKFSPCIGQRAANVIARETLRRCAALGLDVTVLVWVDNFLFGADSLSDAQCLQDIFIQVARECNLAVHPSTEIGTSLTALGFELDTVSKTLRHSLKFRESLGTLHRSISHTSSIREVSRFVGHCVWSIFARRIPLATIPAITKALREIHSAITIRHVAWDAPCRLDMLPLVQATQSLVDSRELSFSLPEASEGAWLEVYSDAMVDGELATWAFVSGDHVSQGEFTFKTHIFIHELLAASSALMAAAQVNPSGQTILFVDNTPAIFALRAGHSGNVWGDYILGRLFSELPATFRFKVAHVSGLFNPSDEYTRGSHGFEGQWNFTNWV